MKYKNIAITSSKEDLALERKAALIKKYNFLDANKDLGKADLLLVLGGDGTMLHFLHKYENIEIPFYGINCGTVGFLMNNPDDKKLIAAINKAEKSTLNPLKMTAISIDGKTHKHIAINDVSLLRQLSQTARIKITVDDEERIECLTADGVLIATAAGSTAYNMSLRGPIIPFGTKILALTPISPFRPRNWPGAILSSNAKIEFEILDSKTRPVSATADYIEVRNVKKVIVQEDVKKTFTILFDPHHSLQERITQEQFVY